MDRLIKYRICWVLAVLLALFGCAHQGGLPPERGHEIYTVQQREDDPITHHAPMFLIYDYEKDYNRIGQPSAGHDEQGREEIYVDVERPVVYYMVRKFRTHKGTYTNYIYRVHFPRVPFSLIPFHLTAGNNVGLLVFVTVDARNRPVLVTTVHTCGCYLSIVPTSYLPVDALPEDWKQVPIKVYGERLPWKLEYARKDNPKLLVHLRPEVHRVMNLEIVEGLDLCNRGGSTMIVASLAPMEELERIPIDGKTTSFYHDKGLLKGHVKGAVKLWESIFLSLISLDPFVGTDKAYADTKVTGKPFYTTLKRWDRSPSDMWNFPGFLKYWGWRL